MTNPKHVLVLPAFNEAAALPPLLKRVEQLRGQNPALSEMTVIVVNDGSYDETQRVAASVQGTRVISHPRNYGLAAALKTGLSAALEYVEGEGAIIVMDADDTHNPAAIPHMLDAIATGADVVIGSRFAPGGVEEGIPWHRRLLSRGAATLMRSTCNLAGVRDYTCGYRAYRSAAVQKILEHEWVFDSLGFSVTVGLLLVAAQAESRITEVPITVHYGRKPGESHMRTLPTILGTLRAARTYRSLRRSVTT